MIVLSDIYFGKNSIFLYFESGRYMFHFDIDDYFYLHIVEVADDEVIIVLEEQTVGNLYLFIQKLAPVRVTADRKPKVLAWF